MQIIDNVNETVGKHLANDIRKGSRLSIAAACFSIYAYRELRRRFNEETDDGRRMEAVSALLGKAVESIVAVKAESDIDSLFTAGGTSALLGEVSGLDDFELICFLVVKEESTIIFD